jgi:hypothetical protein
MPPCSGAAVPTDMRATNTLPTPILLAGRRRCPSRRTAPRFCPTGLVLAQRELSPIKALGPDISIASLWNESEPVFRHHG